LTTTAESLESLETLAHPLEELAVIGNDPVTSKEDSDVAAGTTRRVARSLHLLFPNLKELVISVESQASFWAEVREMIKLCQAVVRDEKQRSSRRNMGIETDIWSPMPSQ
jgi:hypothetical protein